VTHTARDHCTQLLDRVYSLANSAAKDGKDSVILSTRRRSEKTDQTKLDESGACATYGELTKSSMSKLFAALCGLNQPGCRLCSGSSFVDLGSGFGLPVFCALAASDVRRVTGIELLTSRLQISQNILADAEVKRLLPTGADVKFIHADITARSVWASQAFTHVFSFDAAFTEDTCSAIAGRLLELQSWTVFVSSHKKTQWASYGLRDIELLDKVTVSMRTSQEQRTLYVFQRLPAGATPARPLDSAPQREDPEGPCREGTGKRSRRIRANTATRVNKQHRGHTQERVFSGVWDHSLVPMRFSWLGPYPSRDVSVLAGTRRDSSSSAGSTSSSVEKCDCPTCMGLRDEPGPAVDSPAFVAEAKQRADWRRDRGLGRLLQVAHAASEGIRRADEELAVTIVSLQADQRYRVASLDAFGLAAQPSCADACGAKLAGASSDSQPAVASADSSAFDARVRGDWLLAPCSERFPRIKDKDDFLTELQHAHRKLVRTTVGGSNALLCVLRVCVQYVAEATDHSPAAVCATSATPLEESAHTPTREIDVEDVVCAAQAALQALGTVADVYPTLRSLPLAIGAVKDVARELCGPDRINVRDNLPLYTPPSASQIGSYKHATSVGFGVIRGQVSHERCSAAVSFLRANGLATAQVLANEYRFSHCLRANDSLLDPLSSTRRRMLSLNDLPAVVDALELNSPQVRSSVSALLGSASYQFRNFHALHCTGPVNAQLGHTDMDTSDGEHRDAMLAVEHKPWSGFVALTFCTLDVWPGALVCSREFAEGVREGRLYEPRSVALHPGDAIYFRGDLFHGGSASTAESFRVHFEVLHSDSTLRFPENGLSFVPHTGNLMWSVGPTGLERPEGHRTY
jgi:hypothetical protein